MSINSEGLPHGDPNRSIDWAEIDSLLRAGQLAEAIQRYHAENSVELAIAKGVVEQRLKLLKIARPSDFRSKRTGNGCATISLLALLVFCGAGLIWFKVL